MDSYIIANFRRERTYLEVQAEVDAALTRGEQIKHVDIPRFVSMGAMAMAQIPDVGKFIFVNGSSYQVKDQTWSIHIPEDENQPNFHDPEVMLTLIQTTDHTNGYAPKEDFRV